MGEKPGEEQERTPQTYGDISEEIFKRFDEDGKELTYRNSVHSQEKDCTEFRYVKLNNIPEIFKWLRCYRHSVIKTVVDCR